MRRKIASKLPEPVLRELVRVRHGETAAQRRLTERRLRGRRLKAAVHLVADDNVGACELRRRTRDRVVAALEAAGIEFVALPGVRRAVVGVAAEDRGRALAALRRHLTEPEWVASIVDQRVRLRRNRLPLHASVLASVDSIRLYRLVVAPNGDLLFGEATACEIDFWPEVMDDRHVREDGGLHEPGSRLAPRANGVAAYLPAGLWRAAASRSEAHWLPDRALPEIFDVTAPVDLVYTWVDGDDPDWQKRKASYSARHALGELNPSAAHRARYTSHDELRYSLRSVAMFADWVRHIFIVTDDQVPNWLNTAHPNVSVIDHKEIFTDPSVLPVFNSHAIESQLHHIPGLSEHYLYLNDDFFFGRPVDPELFFHANGIAKFFLSPTPLDLADPSSRDLPVLSAAKRNRNIIEQTFGVTIRHKVKHTPHAQLRSVLDHMERRHPDEFARVAASRFRHPDDISIPAALAHYYAFGLGRSVPGTIEYRYQDISYPNTQRRLDALLRDRRSDVFCLNESSRSRTSDEVNEMLVEFFEQYFPIPSPYELRRDRRLEGR